MLDYGLIGNCKSSALVSKKGSIDWFCYPNFNSPSVFAKLLDNKKGGSFSVHPKGVYKVRQQYAAHTNVLETYYENKKDAFVIIDFLPRYRKIVPNKKTKVYRKNRLVRIIKPLRGKPILKVAYRPALDYASGQTITKAYNGRLTSRKGKHSIHLVSNVDYDLIRHELYFKLDFTKYFVLGEQPHPDNYSVKRCNQLLSATKKYWRQWVSSLSTPQTNKELIIRSALVLKLLTFSETGAIIAAPTTSIPEALHTNRTFDYRFCWVRDAAFTADALKKIGRDHEAKKLIEFIFNCTIPNNHDLQIMYGIHGETKLKQKELPHLAGFKNTKPVVTGNPAHNQKQNDIYGSVIDMLYLYYVYYEYESRLPKKYWNFLKYLVHEIQTRWRQKDSGIWEFRGVNQHFTYSKLMCFVGMDRAALLAQHFGYEKEAEEWMVVRDQIKENISVNAWNADVRAFTMHYGAKDLDAAVLLMSYHSVFAHDDPRLVHTVEVINEGLRKDGLVQRYAITDDFGEPTSAFTICAFWLVDAFYWVGKVKEAKKLFNSLLKHANHVGLFSEDIDLKSRQLLGNFPQGYTHIALINSAILLSEWSAKRRKFPGWKEHRLKIY